MADGRVWVGRQVVFIQQVPAVTFENSSTLGFSLDASSVVQWSGALLDNLRGNLAHGISGHIVSTPLPPPFPPIPQYSFATTVSVGTLGQDSHILNIPAEPAGVAVPGRTLGATTLYDAGNGTLATVPGDTSSGNGLRAFALQGAGAAVDRRRPPTTAHSGRPRWTVPTPGGPSSATTAPPCMWGPMPERSTRSMQRPVRSSGAPRSGRP